MIKSVGIIVPARANKGPVLVAKDVADFLIKQNVAVTLYYFDDVNELVLHCPAMKLSWFKKHDFSAHDVIHLHGVRPYLYSWLKLKRITAKKIATIHGYFSEEFSFSYGKVLAGILNWGINHVLTTSDAIVVLSRTMQRYYARFHPESKLKVIHNGKSIVGGEVPEGDIAKITNFRQDSILIGTAAVLIKRKGLDQLVKAMKYLPNYKLLIIGNGPEYNALIELSEQLHLDKKCLFIGYRNNAHKYYPLFDIYAITSYSEGFPLALLEAAAYAKPSVCPSLERFRELFNNDEVSFFELGDIKSLAEAIETAWKHRNTLSPNFFSSSLRYSVDQMNAAYLNLFNECQTE